MENFKSLSAETDEKIQKKEKEIQDQKTKKQKLIQEMEEKIQKLSKELRELKEKQQRERNDGVGKLFKKNNIDLNEFAKTCQKNPDMFEMLLMMIKEQQEEVQTDIETKEDTEPEEQIITDEETENYDDSEDDYIDFNN